MERSRRRWTAEDLAQVRENADEDAETRRQRVASTRARSRARLNGRARTQALRDEVVRVFEQERASLTPAVATPSPLVSRNTASSTHTVSSPRSARLGRRPLARNRRQ